MSIMIKFVKFATVTAVLSSTCQASSEDEIDFLISRCNAWSEDRADDLVLMEIEFGSNTSGRDECKLKVVKEEFKCKSGVKVKEVLVAYRRGKKLDNTTYEWYYPEEPLWQEKWYCPLDECTIEPSKDSNYPHTLTYKVGEWNSTERKDAVPFNVSFVQINKDDVPETNSNPSFIKTVRDACEGAAKISVVGHSKSGGGYDGKHCSLRMRKRSYNEKSGVMCLEMSNDGNQKWIVPISNCSFTCHRIRGRYGNNIIRKVYSVARHLGSIQTFDFTITEDCIRGLKKIVQLSNSKCAQCSQLMKYSITADSECGDMVHDTCASAHDHTQCAILDTTKYEVESTQTQTERTWDDIVDYRGESGN